MEVVPLGSQWQKEEAALGGKRSGFRPVSLGRGCMREPVGGRLVFDYGIVGLV